MQVARFLMQFAVCPMVLTGFAAAPLSADPLVYIFTDTTTLGMPRTVPDVQVTGDAGPFAGAGCPPGTANAFVEVKQCIFFVSTIPNVPLAGAVTTVYFHKPGAPADVGTDYLQLDIVGHDANYTEGKLSFFSVDSTFTIPNTAIADGFVLEETSSVYDVTALLQSGMGSILLPAGFAVQIQPTVPVPSPGTAGLLVLGIAVFGTILRRLRKRVSAVKISLQIPPAGQI